MPKSVLKATATTIDIDRGQRRLEKEIKKFALKPYVAIGFLADGKGKTIHRGGGRKTNAFIATVNEFGAPRANVPERSFMRSTMDEQRAAFIKKTRKLLRQITKGRMDSNKALRLLGVAIRRAIKKKIVDLNSPPNAPSTIAAKGSSNPLIDSGQMLRAVQYQVVEGRNRGRPM